MLYLFECFDEIVRDHPEMWRLMKKYSLKGELIYLRKQSTLTEEQKRRLEELLIMETEGSLR